LILAIAFLSILPMWFGYSLISKSHIDKTISPEEAQKQLLVCKLHLINQKERPVLFLKLLDAIQEVDIHRRKEVLKGPEMLKWFRRLMISEQERFLDTILPQSLTRTMKDFSKLPYETQLEQMHKALMKLKNSDKVADQVMSGIDSIPEDVEEFKAKLIEHWSKQTPHQIHGLVLEKVFLRLNAGDGQANTYDMAKAMMYEDAITEAKGPFDEADVNS
jgi:hypothetical protein